MTINIKMTRVVKEVKALIIEDTIQNLKTVGRLQDDAVTIRYRQDLSGSSAKLIVEEWGISKKRSSEYAENLLAREK
jgi:hypothetical protein